MIRINLLPEEYRRKARTPIKVMLALAGGVAVNATLLAWWCWLHFGVAAEVESDRSVLQMELDGLTPLVAYHEALQAENKFHASREETLAQITKERVLWTKVLDELIDIVHLGGEGVRHYIWFDDLTVKQEEGKPAGRNQSAASYGALKAAGHSGSAAWNQLAAFLDDFHDPRLSSFPLNFFPPAAPEGSANKSDADLIPAVNWSFPLSLELRSPQERFDAEHPVDPKKNSPKGVPK